MAKPRSCASNMSAMIPPELVMVDEPNVPAKNRKMSIAFIVLAPHTPALKAVKGT